MHIKLINSKKNVYCEVGKVGECLYLRNVPALSGPSALYEG
ncbi:hypothetical protein CLV93_10918 [Prolixibacter denitrificans]|uniref:Uncharacterized protein n=1 Tax=Prolixibacter denitrificans TaxID=1541063 RepID=A0A2P8C8X5_9BACT|nr:hypothetical protein CLV93_10918 [Prolixibacter denitrificans]